MMSSDEDGLEVLCFVESSVGLNVYILRNTSISPVHATVAFRI